MSELTGRHVWIDGRLEPGDGLHLSAFDRGFQLGDGIFETLRARGGRPTELEEHLARLRGSAAGLDIDLPASVEADIASGIDALLAADHLGGPDGDASIRITVSRGVVAARGLLPVAESRATIVIQAWPVAPPPAGHLEVGLHLVASAIRRDPANPLAALKTTSRADFVHARLEARRAGADDALFLTTDGHLSEATSANIFLVRGSELATPSLDCAILAGTTRTWILRWAVGAGLTTAESRLAPVDLAGAGEAFVCSSVAGILPVTRFNGSLIGSGRPGPVDRSCAGRARGVHPGRGRGHRVTRDELVRDTRQLIAEGDRLVANPSHAALRTWLQLSDDLLARAWGSMDRYHLAWLQVGRPPAAVRGREMTDEEQASYVREVAAAKTAVLKMSVEALTRRAMPFLGETRPADG